MGKTYSEDDMARLAELIGEDFSYKLDAAIETIDDRIDRKLQPLIEDMSVLKTDMKAVKAAITYTNKDLHTLESRVGKLEIVA